MTVFCRELKTCSTSFTTQDTNSLTDRPGSAPNRFWGAAWSLSAVLATRLATNFSKPLLNQDSSNIWRHHFAVLWSFPIFGKRKTSASLKTIRKWWSRRDPSYIVFTARHIRCHVARSILLVIPSAPGASSLRAVAAKSASYSETFIFHGRIPARSSASSSSLMSLSLI